MAKRDVGQVIAEAESLLATARFGLQDMQTNPERRAAGFRNAVVFGRTVTIALQNLRSAVPDFDDWYKQHTDELASDPLCRFFVGVRNMIEKKARTPLVRSTKIGAFSVRSMADFGAAPPGASGFVIADPTGQAGWRIPQPDGSIEMYYVAVPGLTIESMVLISDVPEDEDWSNQPAHELVSRYLDRLEKVVVSARSRFGGHN